MVPSVFICRFAAWIIMEGVFACRLNKTIAFIKFVLFLINILSRQGKNDS